MVCAWRVFEKPALTAAFLEHVDARLHQYGDLCRGTDYNAKAALTQDLRTDDCRRRLFLRARLAGPVTWILSRRLRAVGLLMPADFDWLLSVSPAGASPIVGLDEDSLCNAVDVLFSPEDQLQFEAIFLAARNGRGCTSISLRSSTVSSWLRQRPLTRAPVWSKNANWPRCITIRPCRRSTCRARSWNSLSRAEAGDWQAWWQLNVRARVAHRRAPAS